ncbi:hypothetical protein PJ311_00255 [Bacillus sp. CLL-7-23]|uniref:Transcriptional regulator n=1 Tax=Bacillus changyiensis TaxID=3004103 RepID=A0ABT4WYC1_9BACI|nr:hypothetical protein [Bacillus changyiensis]MDA7025039.1 hypothetical protein [Bacillus changyiensis]
MNSIKGWKSSDGRKSLKDDEEKIKELKSLCLWSIRRLHQTYKDFDEYEKITGDSPERL